MFSLAEIFFQSALTVRPGITSESAGYFSSPPLSVVNAARGQKIRSNREKISMASGMRQLPGTLRFQLVQELHTCGLAPAARGV